MVLICAQELVLGHLPRVPTVMEPAALDEKLPLPKIFYTSYGQGMMMLGMLAALRYITLGSLT